MVIANSLYKAEDARAHVLSHIEARGLTLQERLDRAHEDTRTAIVHVNGRAQEFFNQFNSERSLSDAFSLPCSSCRGLSFADWTLVREVFRANGWQVADDPHHVTLRIPAEVAEPAPETNDEANGEEPGKLMDVAANDILTRAAADEILKAIESDESDDSVLPFHLECLLDANKKRLGGVLPDSAEIDVEKLSALLEEEGHLLLAMKDGNATVLINGVEVKSAFDELLGNVGQFLNEMGGAVKKTVNVFKLENVTRHRHYKGAVYYRLFEAVNCANSLKDVADEDKMMVVYMNAETNVVYIRPKDEFDGDVIVPVADESMPNGGTYKKLPRFEKI